ncbi:MAG: LysR family transcriptional regulator [Angelakisella sp.]|nr:LysR family transcriptional regulator [Angelakisella sp.]
MKFDEKQIEFIVTIAKEGGISAAAKKLYLTQPALSQRLANLEQELGFRIFRRDVTPMVPTEEGALYLSTLQEMLQLHRNFQRRLEARRDGKHGCISLALSPMRAQQLLPRLFPELRRSLPGLEVRLLHGSDRAALHRLTREGTADFSINSQVYPDLVQEVVAVSGFVLVVPAGHPLARAKGSGTGWEDRETVTLEMVEDDLFLLNYRTQGSRIILEQYFQDQGFTPRRYMELYDNYTIARLVEAGVGVAVLSMDNAADYIPKLGLQAFRLRNSPRSRIYLSYRRSLLLTPIMESFIRLCKSPVLWTGTCRPKREG